MTEEQERRVRYFDPANAHNREIHQHQATLAADPKNETALRHLVRLVNIPRLEALLHRITSVSHGYVPWHPYIAEVKEQIAALHRGELPDHVRHEHGAP